MTESEEPVETTEFDDWNADSQGSMADHATHDDEVETVPYEED